MTDYLAAAVLGGFLSGLFLTFFIVSLERLFHDTRGTRRGV